MIKAKRILCPVYFSDNSKSVIELALGMLLEPTGAEFHLMYVLPRVSYYDWNMLGNPLLIETNGIDEANMVATLDMERLVGEMRERHPELTFFSTIGDSNNPANMIVEEALKYGFDLIVMSTHGRKGFDRLLMGSVAEHVLRDAHCDVIVYRKVS